VFGRRRNIRREPDALEESLASGQRPEYDSFMSYQEIITIEPGKRGGRPCIRGMRIAVGDVLGWLAAGMSHEQILDEYPELTERDIRACLAYAADRERRLLTV
jgi:uncharacterized protein (DUF433 family)